MFPILFLNVSSVFQNPHFIRCIKANNDGIIDLFDSNIIKPQLKANSIVPYINLMRKGYPTRISYAQFFPNFDDYLPGEILTNQKKLAELLLLTIGCETTDFKLGETHIFFRPGKSDLYYQMNMSDATVIRNLASEIESRMREEQKPMLSKIETIDIEQPVQLFDHPNRRYFIMVI